MSKYFLTIKELPAINWIELSRSNDLVWLKRSGEGNVCSRAGKVFESIRDQIIDEFGVSEEFLRLHKAGISLELLECELLHSGDRSLQFHIDMEEKVIQDLMKPLTSNKKNDLFDAMIWIKKQQITFNENEVSTFWFLKYMDHLMKTAKKENKNG